MINVSYIDFWPGFDVNCNWFNLLLKNTFKDKNFCFDSDPKEADVIFFSCFGSLHKEFKDSKAVKILYIGENVPANFDVADYCLSFDFDSHNGKNFRLPHWYLYINWWNELDFPHARISMEDLFREYDPKSVSNRNNFCSIIIGNPVQNRIEVATKLNNYKQVHGYGRVFGKPYDGCKIELLKNYRWNICFENSITKGYVTEKLLEAKVAGCVPIYYGPYHANKDFNEECYINYFDFASSDELFDKIVEIDKDPTKFRNLVSKPLFKQKPNLEPLEQFLKNIIG